MSLGPLLAVERGAEHWEAVWRGDGSQVRAPLPDSFDPSAYQQWRLTRRGGRVAVAWEEHDVGVFDVLPGPAALGLAASGPAAFEMVRATMLV
jgi:hypothetical protein